MIHSTTYHTRHPCDARKLVSPHSISPRAKIGHSSSLSLQRSHGTPFPRLNIPVLRLVKKGSTLPDHPQARIDTLTTLHIGSLHIVGRLRCKRSPTYPAPLATGLAGSYSDRTFTCKFIKPTRHTHTWDKSLLTI